MYINSEYNNSDIIIFGAQFWGICLYWFLLEYKLNKNKNKKKIKIKVEVSKTLQNILTHQT